MRLLKNIWNNYIKNEPAWAFLCNFSLIMLFFSISRIFFFLFNKSYFPVVDFGHLMTLLKGGIQFDLTALLYVNALYLVLQILPFKFRYHSTYQKVAKWIYLVMNGIVFIVNCIDIAFFRFTNRRTTSTIFSEFQNENNIFGIFGQSVLTYWPVTLFVLVMLFLLYKLYYTPTIVRKEKVSLLSNVKFYTIHTLIFVVFGFFTVIGIRGGFGSYTRPITLSNANKYVKKGNENAIVLNTPFCIFRTLDKKVYKNPKYFQSQEELEAIFSPIHHPHPEEPFKPMNVVVIIWESFGKEYTGFFNKDLDNGTYKGYTPFLDSLFEQGLTFKYSYCNGRKSIDGMPSVLSSIPMFIEPFMLTSYATNDIGSLVKSLKTKGYYSAFFHGAPNSSMGFQAYANVAGFEDYFGMTEYNDNKDFDGTWAIWDEEFLQFYADEMGKMKQPFVTSVFTASSHHPFKIPKRYEGKFPEGPHPILKCVSYSDYSMKKFFEKMSKYDWYDNTLFVITADHTNQVQHDEYFTDVNLFSVPILFYHPGSNLKGLVDSIPAQQIDIMPSVLSYLNYDEPYFAYGEDVIKNLDPNKFVITFNNQKYQLWQHDWFLQFDGEKTTAMYDYKTDIFLKHNMVGKVKEQAEMETLTKAIIQDYIMRMTENRLTVGQ